MLPFYQCLPLLIASDGSARVERESARLSGSTAGLGQSVSQGPQLTLTGAGRIQSFSCFREDTGGICRTGTKLRKRLCGCQNEWSSPEWQNAAAAGSAAHGEDAALSVKVNG